jgi:AcrR family transcriptional regulator
VTTTSSGSWRDEQTERTRARILEAVVELTAEGIDKLSVSAVAQRSGVSRPTVYRHFPDKQAMLEAVGDDYRRRALHDREEPADLDELLAGVAPVFARFGDLDPGLRAAMWAAGSQARTAGRSQRVRSTDRALAVELEGVEPAERRRLVRAVTTLCSSSTLRAYQTVLGADDAAAAEAVVWTIRTLLRGVTRKPRKRTGGNDKRATKRRKRG